MQANTNDSDDQLQMDVDPLSKPADAPQTEANVTTTPITQTTATTASTIEPAGSTTTPTLNEPTATTLPGTTSTTTHNEASSTAISSILNAIEDFDSSIPDPVVHHFLNAAGIQTNDQRIIRLIAIAAQKFIHDIISDSLQHCKLRDSQGKKKDKRYTLRIEDLSAALSDYGIEVFKQHYFN